MTELRSKPMNELNMEELERLHDSVEREMEQHIGDSGLNPDDETYESLAIRLDLIHVAILNREKIEESRDNPGTEAMLMQMHEDRFGWS